MEFRKMIIILSVATIIIVISLFGVSYAYYSLTNASTSFNAQVADDDISIVYNQGEYVSITTGVPIVEADVPTKAGSNKFSALAGSNLNGYDVAIEISLVDINLEQELRTNDFKVQLLENGSVIKNLTGSNIDSNSSVVLKDMAIINVGTTYNYELRVWIQESGVSQNELMGKSFSGKIEISSSIKK